MLSGSEGVETRSEASMVREEGKMGLNVRVISRDGMSLRFSVSPFAASRTTATSVGIDWLLGVLTGWTLLGDGLNFR